MKKRVQRTFALNEKIQLVIEEIPTAQSAAVGIFVGSGSRHESSRYRGVAHLAEHLFFKGTKSKIAEEISEISERYGGELNAYTDREITAFHAAVPAFQLEEISSLLLELILDSLFEEDAFEKERKVVIEELKGYEDNPDEVFSDRMLEVPWGNHPLAWRIGAQSKDIRKLQHSHVLNYLEDTFFHRPWVISVVSPLKAEKILKFFRKELKKAQDQYRWGAYLSVRPKKLHQSPPVLSGRMFSRSEFDKFKSEQVQVAYYYPSVSLSDPDDVLWTAISSWLGAGSSSKLYTALREDRALVYSTYAQHLSFSDAGLFSGYFACGPKHFEEAIQLSARTMHEAALGIPTAEAKWVRESLEGVTLMSFDALFGRMESMARQQLLYGKILSLKQAMSELKRIQPKNLNPLLKVLSKTPCFYVQGPMTPNVLKKIKSIWLSERVD